MRARVHVWRRCVAALLFAALLAGAVPSVASAATVTVTSTADSGHGSLRATVAAATASDTVTIPAGSYVLATPVVVDKTLTLQGAGARSTILDGGFTTRLLTLQPPAGQVTIQGVRITRGKVAGPGGGIYSLVPLILRDSALVGNQATAGPGGGLYQGSVLTMERTLLAGNSAPASDGGGVELAPAGAPTSTIRSSTITQNSASGSGGGINVDNSSAQFLNIVNSTLDANTLSGSGQGGNFRAWTSTTVRMRNTWTGHGVAGSGPNCYQAGSAFVISQGNNAQDGNDAECHFNGANGDKVNVDDKFTPLQDNGGPSDTLAPGAGSPLLDAGDGATCAATDQRGLARPQGAGCDIGAVERTTPTLANAGAEAISASAATITVDTNAQGLPGVLRVDYGPTSAYGPSAQVDIPSTAGAQRLGVPLPGLAAATTYHYRVTLTTPDGAKSTTDATFTSAAAPPAPPPPAAGAGGTKPAARCIVPKLKGLTLAAARTKLARARCRLGTVQRPKRAARGATLVVKAQGPAAGRSLASGAKVQVTLAKKTRKRAKH